MGYRAGEVEYEDPGNSGLIYRCMLDSSRREDSSGMIYPPGPPLKRSRSYSEDEEDDLEARGQIERPSRRQRTSLDSDGRSSGPYSPASPFTHTWPSSEWGPVPINHNRWDKPVDEIALLSAIEAQAATYTVESGAHEILSPYDHILLNTPSGAPNSVSRRSSFGGYGTPDRLRVAGAAEAQKPFKCHMCPKSFTRNYDLTRHKSSHQDERAHVCGQCGRSFNRRDALSRHSLVRGCGVQQQPVV